MVSRGSNIRRLVLKNIFIWCHRLDVVFFLVMKKRHAAENALGTRNRERTRTQNPNMQQTFV
jgi:hypothetical protein